MVNTFNDCRQSFFIKKKCIVIIANTVMNIKVFIDGSHLPMMIFILVILLS